jgi:hypothetical protein
MDIDLLASPPSGVNLMPSSPPLAPHDVEPWVEDLNHKFMDTVTGEKVETRLAALPHYNKNLW